MKLPKLIEDIQNTEKSEEEVIRSKELISDLIESSSTTEELIAKTRRILEESKAGTKKHKHVRFNSES